MQLTSTYSQDSKENSGTTIIMNVFDSQSTSMGHAKDTHIRKSISDHEDEAKKIRVVPTRRRSSRMFQPPGETDFLTEYKGASGMFYAKSNTSSQYQVLESSKNDENDTTANFPTDGNDDSRSPTATRKENVSCSCQQDHDESRDTRNPLLSKALHELDQSLIAGDRQRMAQAWNSLGLVRLHTQLKPHEAIRCHRNALQLLLSSSSSPTTSTTEEDSSSSSGACQGACSSQHLLELATTYKDLGLCYERLNDTNEAMAMYLEAQKILSTEKLLVETHPQILALKRAIDRIQRIL